MQTTLCIDSAMIKYACRLIALSLIDCLERQFYACKYASWQ